MKITCLVIALLVSARMTQGQVGGTAALPAPTPYAVVTNTANSRTWERTVYEPSPNGTVVPVKSGYTELASGLYFQSNGQWMASQELIESFPQGAIARQGQYQVIFANNLNSAGAIDMQTPDGKRLRSSILGLAYYDTATGSNVLFAQIQDSQGELISSNQVLYSNAFDGATADVRYSYKKGSFEQDVILRTQPPAPESLGLNSQSTEIEVLTEFINPPQASVVAHPMKNSSLPDEEIGWGAMRIGRGRAFDLGEPQKGRSRINVRRQYVTAQGRTILVEGVPVRRIKTYLENLPLEAGATTNLPVLASKTLELPNTPLAKGEQRPMQLASALPPNKGFVLDYMELNYNTNHFTFQAGTTYLISGPVNLGDGSETESSVIFQGGSVIKFTADALTGINYDQLDANYEGDGANPVILTSKDDNNFGAWITNSTGEPTTLTNVTYLNNVGNGGQSPNYLYFYYAGTAMNATDPTYIYNCQFFDCYQAILICDGEVDVYNCLFSQCATVIDFTEAGCWYDGTNWGDYEWVSYASTIQNITADQIGQFFQWPSGGWDDGQVSVYLANSIFTQCPDNSLSWLFFYAADTDTGTGTAGYDAGTGMFGRNIPFTYNLPSSPYVTGGNVNYYLASNSICHDGGTALLGEIETMTTYAPQDGSWPDTNGADLGYHYPTNEDSFYDGLPDWWEWKWFGGYGETGSELDSGGIHTLLYDYTNNLNPFFPVVSVYAAGYDAIRPSPVVALTPGNFLISVGTSVASNLPVYFTTSGTASNGVDYVLRNYDTGQIVTNLVIIPALSTHEEIELDPIANPLSTSNLTATITLQTDVTYQVVSNTASASVTIEPAITIVEIYASSGDAIRPSPGFAATPGSFSIVPVVDDGDTVINTNMAAYFTIGGTASNGVDYVLRDGYTGALITNSITIWTNNDDGTGEIEVDPATNLLCISNLTVTITLKTNSLYLVNSNLPAASINIDANVFSLVATNISDPCGIDYNPFTNSLILSSQSNNIWGFLRINSNGVVTRWSGVQFTNGGNEVELATVKSTANGFTNGEMFFDSSGNGTIGRLSPNGSLSNMNFATVSGNAFSGLYMDQSGSFGTNLIAGQGGGSVWLIKSNGVANQIVPAGGIEGDPEGIISLTNNGTNYGPWAGKIVTGLQGDVYDDCVIYAVSNMGVVSDYPSSFYPSLNMEVEDCDVIVTNQNLYVEDDADGWIVKVSSGVFTNHIGDVLITDSGYWDFVPALYIVHWNPATQSFVTTRISSPYINESIEQSTFAPINTPPVSP